MTSLLSTHEVGLGSKQSILYFMRMGFRCHSKAQFRQLQGLQLCWRVRRETNVACALKCLNGIDGSQSLVMKANMIS